MGDLSFDQLPISRINSSPVRNRDRPMKHAIFSQAATNLIVSSRTTLCPAAAGRRGLSHHALFQDVGIMRMKPHPTRQFVAQLIAAFFRNHRPLISTRHQALLRLPGARWKKGRNQSPYWRDLHQSLTRMERTQKGMWYQLDGHYTILGSRRPKTRRRLHVRTSNLQFRRTRIRWPNSQQRQISGHELRHQFFMEWMHRRIEPNPSGSAKIV